MHIPAGVRPGRANRVEGHLVAFLLHRIMRYTSLLLCKFTADNVAAEYDEQEIQSDQTQHIRPSPRSNLVSFVKLRSPICAASQDAFFYPTKTLDKVDGVVVRISSPGGDALASDLIWREVMC